MVGQDRQERDAGELLERERMERRALQREKHARLRIVSRAVQDLVAHAHVIKGWAELVKREPLNTADRASAMMRIVAAVAQQLDTLDRLGLSTASLAERPVFELTRVNLSALVAAIVADSGERAELEEPAERNARPPALIVLADAEYVVRTVRALVDATISPARVSVTANGERAEVRVTRLLDVPRETLDRVTLLADIQGGGLEVEADTAVFWLPMEDRDRDQR